METDPPTRGWHDDPSQSGLRRYWDGHAWTGTTRTDGDVGIGAYSLRGWRRIWFQKVVRFPGVFYPIVWLDCSVPLTRGRLSRFTQPRELRGTPPTH